MDNNKIKALFDAFDTNDEYVSAESYGAVTSMIHTKSPQGAENIRFNA